jgi:hypothetical protein
MVSAQIMTEMENQQTPEQTEGQTDRIKGGGP